MADWESVLVGCPFFKRINRQNISCEGVFRNSTGSIWFPNTLQRDRVLNTYCKEGYQKCPLYRILWDKYE